MNGYADFWLRFFAYVVDALICSILNIAVWFTIGIVGELTGTTEAAMVVLYGIWSVALIWLYFAVMESSKWQGTIGKRLVEIRVTDLNGKRITFNRATGRHFAKVLSGLTLGVGFVMAGITDRKQALHDIVAQCLVLRKGPGPSYAGPVAQDARIDAMDVLRGFALLGILVINIQFFAMPDVASVNPSAYGDLQGVNFNVWLGSRMLALQRFMTLFSMLFGAGIVLMAARAEARGESRGVLHYRRMAWLALIGLLHAHLLWAGDILFVYAVCGMLVYLLRGLSARLLLPIGATAIAVPSVFFWVLGASMAYWPDEILTLVIAEGWQPTQATIDEFLTAYRGGWLEQIPLRSTTALGVETFGLFFYGPRVIGLMLVGMALFKLDVFSAGRSRRFYVLLALLGLAVGLSVEAYGVVLDLEHGWAATWSMFHGLQFNYWPSIAVSLGYVGLVMLACQSAVLHRVTRPFAAVGQTALSNYLLQTVICTTIFYGRGLGYYGSVDRLGQLSVVVGVWVAQLVVSPLWLRHYRFGPAEWVWRSLTYGTRPPLRRASPRRISGPEVVLLWVGLVVGGHLWVGLKGLAFTVPIALVVLPATRWRSLVERVPGPVVVLLWVGLVAGGYLWTGLKGLASTGASALMLAGMGMLLSQWRPKEPPKTWVGIFWSCWGAYMYWSDGAGWYLTVPTVCAFFTLTAWRYWPPKAAARPNDAS